MRMDPIQINNKNQLINDYRNNQEEISTFFDYNPFKSFEERVKDLHSRTFKREELADVLHSMNKQWGAPDSTIHNIERFRDPNSVVVIGGQQAGLMTGPLYTINKIISLIQCAKEKEAHLKIPVIPVFWIAGEDHDYDEINHIFLLNDNKMEKNIISQQIIEKKPISDIAIDHNDASQWVNNIFRSLEETEHTRTLYETVQECLNHSTTYVDFFASFIYKLFIDDGLVLIDSGNRPLRRLESDYFIEFIKHQPEISASVYKTQQQLTQLGYEIPLDIKQTDAHLFVHINGERILLNRNETGEWVGKQNEIKLTTEEMISIAKNKPEMLSNNVISRPLMQELLFPSLSFIGGDGEISYWSVLKNAFHILDINMPPILPRLSITYLPRNIESLLKKYDITIHDAINQGVERSKEEWLDAQIDVKVEDISEQFKQTVIEAHEPLRLLAEKIQADVGELASKNLQIIKQHIDFLENRMTKEVERQFCHQIGQFDLMNVVLRPFEGLQERVWNVLPLVNNYGMDLLQNIVQTRCSFTEKHFIVYL